MRQSSNSIWLWCASAAALLAWTAAPVAADETLSGLRDDVRTPSRNSDDSRPPRDDDDDDYDDDDDCDDTDDGWSLWDLFADDSCDDESEYDDPDDDDSGDSVLGLAAIVLASPYWVPPTVLCDSFSQPGYFAHYPYQYDVGYMLIDPVEAFGIEGPREPYWWAARVRGEFGTGFDDLDWIGGRVQLDTRSRFGIESDFRYVREDLDAGRDTLWLGDANVLFRFAQSESVQFRTGLGFNFLADEIGSDFGFNFTYAVDCQPVRPLTFAAELDLGTLGHATLVHVRTTAGVVWGVSEAYIGYDLYDIGSTQVQGLVAGVQVWY